MTASPQDLYGRSIAIARRMRPMPRPQRNVRVWRLDPATHGTGVEWLLVLKVHDTPDLVTVRVQRDGKDFGEPVVFDGAVGATLAAAPHAPEVREKRAIAAVLAIALSHHFDTPEGLHDTDAWATWNALNPNLVKGSK